MEGSHLPLVFCGLILGLFLNVVHVSSMFSDCPDNIFKATTGSIEVSWTIPTYSANSGITVTSSHTSGSSLTLEPSGNKTQVTYSATNDLSGEIVDECIFNIYVVDSSGELPVIFDCPDDIHVEAPSLKDSVYVSWEEPRAVNERGELRLVHRNYPEPAGTFKVGPFPVFYTWMENENKSFDCSFFVFVIAPESNVTCPDDIAREIPSRDILLNVSWEEPRTAFENLTLRHQSHNLSYGIFGVGHHKVSFSWADNVGHTVECNFSVTITVIEYPPPEVIGCPDDIEREVLSNGDFTNVTWEEPRAESDAGRVSLQSQTETSGTIFPVGNFRVVYTWKDIAGKTANCSFFVRVTVKVKPTQPPEGESFLDIFLDLSLEVQVGIGAGLLVVIVCVITCLIMCCRCKSSKRRDRRTRRRRPQNPPPPYAPRPRPNEVPLKTSRANLGRELPRTPVPTPNEVAPPYVYETPINDQDNQEDYLQPREKPPSYYSHNVTNIGAGPPRSGYQY